MLTRNALYLAENDGRLAAVRALHGLRWHLDAHEAYSDAQEAAKAFCEGFADVFASCLADALDSSTSNKAAALFDRIAQRAPELIASLDR
jgi:hypothetical protein